MDPATLSNAEWTGIANMLTNLWVMLLLIICIGTLYLATHVGIPSLVASHPLPQSAQRLRLPLYVLMFVGMALYAYFVAAAIGESSVLGDIFDTYWIKGGSIDLLGHGGNPQSVH
ncbi:MAG: hypothetical protein OXD46_12795 [Chloroflexi bacterium]|nr:hypothetical protein [Chloroflexota bacterium]